MFRRAGFNPRHVGTGILAWSRGKVAELIRFVPSGDLAWHGPGFLTWGATMTFRAWIGDGLKWGERISLPQSEVR